MVSSPIVSVVDDDHAVRDVACSLVRSLGLTARGFASAEEFLSSPLVADTSCLISDVKMSLMSGIELQSRLIAEGHKIPIIFFTAFSDKIVEARAMEAGALGVLHKPFDTEDMIRCIYRAMQLSGNTIHEQ